MKLSERIAGGWNRFFFTGFSVQSLGLVRLYLGVGLLPFHVSQFYSLLTLDPSGPRFVYLERVWYFAALGIERYDPPLAILIFALLMVATVTMAIGWHTRLSITVVLLSSIFLQGARDSVAGDTHHRFLIPGMLLFLLLVSESHRTHSCDERRQPSSGPPVDEWKASWPIKAMQLYTVSFYAWSVIAKLRVSGAEWVLGGGKLQEILLRRSVMWGLGEAGEPLGNTVAFHLAHHPGLLTVMGLSVLLLEASFPLVLFLRKPMWRLAFLLFVTAFHVLSFVFLYVGFALLPVVFVIFFDLVPVHTWLKETASSWARCRLDRASRVPG